MDWNIFGPIISAVVAALGAYILQARRLSGRIGASDAESLWNEAALQRADYRERQSLSDARIRYLEDRLAEVELHNSRLALDNYQLMQTVARLEARPCIHSEEL